MSGRHVGRIAAFEEPRLIELACNFRFIYALSTPYVLLAVHPSVRPLLVCPPLAFACPVATDGPADEMSRSGPSWLDPLVAYRWRS